MPADMPAQHEPYVTPLHAPLLIILELLQEIRQQHTSQHGMPTDVTHLPSITADQPEAPARPQASSCTPSQPATIAVQAKPGAKSAGTLTPLRR